MCLSNVTTTGPLIAEEDITVYKFISNCFTPVSNWRELINHGDDCIATINNDIVEGKISIINKDHFDLFICTDNPKFDGRFILNKLGYKYSWFFESDSVKSIIIKGEEIIEPGFETIYQDYPVKIGETYKSKLILNDDDVRIGLHSYIKKPEFSDCYNIVECVIPKGSKYFIGDFKGIKNSIASDTLKYIKIIN